MFPKMPEMLEGGWRRVGVRSTVLTGATIVGAVIGTLVINVALGLETRTADIVASIVLPVILATPILVNLFIRMEQLRLANDKLCTFGRTDWLTGLLNRGAFTQQVEDWMADPENAEPGVQSALLIADADRFKQLNDRYGHVAGDQALQKISDSIMAELGPNDLAGRLGGEEFGVFLANTDLASARRFGDDLRRRINSAGFLPDEDRVLSVSIGSALRAEGESFGQLYRVADQRLYKAKANGRDCVVATDDEAEAPTGKSRAA